MILIFLFLTLFFLLRPAAADAFTYQFKLENNFIDLDFIRMEEVVSDLPIESSESNSIFSFTYKIKTTRVLPKDIPILIAVFDKKVIFSADVSLADNSFHTVEIDLKNLALNNYNQLPVFYQNKFLEGYEIDLFDLSFIESSPDKPSIKINDLNIVREKDNSVTVIFSIQEDDKSPRSYQIICLDEQQEILNSLKLIQKDNFMWPEFSFFNFYSNQKNELIFRLTEFNCDGEAYVVGDEFFKSNKTKIINLEDL